MIKLVLAERVVLDLVVPMERFESLVDEGVESLGHFNSIYLMRFLIRFYLMEYNLLLCVALVSTVDELGYPHEDLNEHESRDTLRQIDVLAINLAFKAVLKVDLGEDDVDFVHRGRTFIVQAKPLDELLPKSVVIDPGVDPRPTLQPVIDVFDRLVIIKAVLQKNLFLLLIPISDVFQVHEVEVFMVTTGHGVLHILHCLREDELGTMLLSFDNVYVPLLED